MEGGAKRWDLPPPAVDHSLPPDLPSAIVKLLVRRNIDTADKLRVFLHPPRSLPYDPLRLAGMDLALSRIFRAIDRQEQVGVFGDFDVDGVTGSAIIAEGLEPFGIRVIPYLPHRTEEGHGLSNSAVERLVDQGVSLITTVDCGVTAYDEVHHAKRLGADVIITDHHLPQTALPDAAAIINPKLPGGGYPFHSLCGAGLAFKLVQGVHDFFGQPWDRSLLELAALGTIADLVPMLDENRYLVAEGIAEMARTRRPGLQAMYRRAGVLGEFLSAEVVAYQLAPRLNAAGRMSHALESYRLLTTKSTQEAESLADKLEALNQQRRQVTEEAMAQANEEVRAWADAGPLPPVLLVSGPAITRGVAGLVAGRLAESHQRPAVALAVDNDYAVGSGRSIPEFDIFAAFSQCQDLFIRFGGHSQAAGFTVSTKNLPALKERLNSVAGNALEERDLRPALDIDAEIGLEELSGDALSWLSTLEPFGQDYPRPAFLTRSARVLEARRVGRAQQHLRLKIADGAGKWTALAFNQSEGWVEGTAAVDLVYSVSRDHWQGEEQLTLRVLDFRAASP